MRSSSSIRKTGARPGLALQRLQHRAADQISGREDIVFHPVTVGNTGSFGKAYLQHLRRIVPLIDGRCDIKAFIALQTDQRPVERGCQHLGDLGLADTGLALEEERPLHAKGKEENRGQRPSGQIIMLCKEIDDGIDRSRQAF